MNILLKKNIFPILFCLLLTLITLLPVFYLYRVIPSIDSGIFLYVGQEITEGKLPYRDVWDHKPPGIFYLNALGLSLTSQSMYGIWIIEFFVFFTSIICLFQFLKKTFPLFTVWITTILYCLCFRIFILEGNNTTEEYGLLFQLVALLLYFSKLTKWKITVLGFTCACAFLLKQNLIGLWCTIWLIEIIKVFRLQEYKQFARFAFFFVSGASLVLIPTSWYFLQKGIFSEFVYAAFTFNFINTSSPTPRLISAFIGFLITLPFSLTVVGGIFLAILKRKKEQKKLQRLLLFSLIWLPFELIFAASTGRFFFHYYVPYLPLFSIFTAYFFLYLKSIIQSRFQLKRSLLIILLSSFLYLFLIFNCYLTLILDDTYHEQQLLNIINQQTKENQQVLVWGVFTSYNYSSERKTSSRILHPYPLFIKGFDSNLEHEYYSILTTPLPPLIIEASDGNWGIPSLDENPPVDFQNKHFVEFQKTFRQNYELKKTLTIHGLRKKVYLRK